MCLSYVVFERNLFCPPGYEWLEPGLKGAGNCEHFIIDSFQNLWVVPGCQDFFFLLDWLLCLFCRCVSISSFCNSWFSLNWSLFVWIRLFWVCLTCFTSIFRKSLLWRPGAFFLLDDSDISPILLFDGLQFGFALLAALRFGEVAFYLHSDDKGASWFA